MPHRTQEERNAYARTKYQEDPVYRAKHLERVARARERQRAEVKRIIAEAKSPGCARCPEVDPVCLDFHHVSGVKIFAIGARPTAAKKRLLAEIAKCEVLCANCHRKEHAKKVQS